VPLGQEQNWLVRQFERSKPLPVRFHLSVGRWRIAARQAEFNPAQWRSISVYAMFWSPEGIVSITWNMLEGMILLAGAAFCLMRSRYYSVDRHDPSISLEWR